MKKDTVSGQNIANILIVDDITANLKVLGDILKQEGYKVRPVPNGTLALQVAEREKPDLILLDIMMPEMDGYEVCRRLKENEKLDDVPVLFISALNDTDDIVKALKSGGVDFITKPFQAEEVLARIATHLELHQQRKKLFELNAEKDKFFSIIAHDLRGPFNGFLGLTEIMVDGIQSMTTEEIREIALSMKASATNLYNLLENLLEWSRMQRGLTAFNPEPLLLISKISDYLNILMESASKKEMLISNSIPQEIKVFADKNMLAVIIRNLVSNAIKFTPEKGQIHISARPATENLVEVSVKDSGIGMSPEMIENLFKMNVNTCRTGINGEPSSGLGLFLCKDFIEKQGGSIWIESETGKGSDFRFTLPMN